MKTSKIFMAIAAVITMTTFTSCEKIKGKGEVINETRSTGTYNAISLAMTATVYFTSGADYSLKISGQENILREVITEVDGTSLVIRVKNGVILKNYDPIRVYITAPEVTGLNISGSGEIFTENGWKVANLAMDISGSGTINLASVEAGHISANISGSGSVKAVSGTATREDLKISGSGTIDLRSINASEVYTTTSGSGDTYVTATNLLDVVISGSGNIWYYGTTAINTHISGSGNLIRM